MDHQSLLKQVITYQVTNDIFHRTRTKISQFIGKHKKDPE